MTPEEFTPEERAAAIASTWTCEADALRSLILALKRAIAEKLNEERN